MPTRVTRSRTRRTGAALLLASLATIALPATAAPASPAQIEPCKVEGATDTGDSSVPWAQDRLDFPGVHALATGAGTTVAVIDSGLDLGHPQTRAIEAEGRIRDRLNVLTAAGFAPDNIRDCEDGGHGTGVAAIIAAPRVSGAAFVGLAPDATIMPIKESDADLEDADDADTLAAAITAAVDADVDVINLSLSIPYDEPAVREAVLAAGRRDIVVVTSSGNDDPGEENPTGRDFPAEYADDGEDFAHVLAVGATTQDAQLSETSTQGDHVGVSAPGEAILVPAPLGNYVEKSGTSFAAPFVSATAALLRERFGGMTAPEVVNRIKATADPPGRSVPDRGFGYGVVNPFFALTALRDDSRLVAPAAPAPRVSAPTPPPPPDRTQQNTAYAVAAGLLGGAGVLAIGSTAWRRTAGERRRPAEH